MPRELFEVSDQASTWKTVANPQKTYLLGGLHADPCVAAKGLTRIDGSPIMEPDALPPGKELTQDGKLVGDGEGRGAGDVGRRGG